MHLFALQMPMSIAMCRVEVTPQPGDVPGDCQDMASILLWHACHARSFA